MKKPINRELDHNRLSESVQIYPIPSTDISTGTNISTDIGYRNRRENRSRFYLSEVTPLFSLTILIH